MLYVILIIVSTIAFGIIGYVIERDALDTFWSVLCGLICSCFISGIILLIADLCTWNNPNLYEVTTTKETYNLLALKDNANTDVNGYGHYFLGCGTRTIESSVKLYYSFMIDTKNGMTVKTIEADGNYIRYSDKPYVECIQVTYRPKSSFVRDWLGITDFSDKNYTYYNIYVPEGTIDTGYKIDLK